MPALSHGNFYNISKTYPKAITSKANIALVNLSFAMHKGETLGLIGANGAGKSTSIKLIMDFIRPNQGTIQIFNHSLNTSQLRHNIGYLPEVANFPANLTILDLLRFTGTTCNLSKDYCNNVPRNC